jgi:hypothetical protein
MLSLPCWFNFIILRFEDSGFRGRRFSFHHHTPVFLGFNKNLEEDRKDIYRIFKNRRFGLTDSDLIRNMATFIIESNHCLKEELTVFKKYI